MIEALTVMSYNIRQGRDLAGVLDLGHIADVIRAQNPDLVALQEVGRHWSGDSDFRDQAAELECRLDMASVFAANVDRAPLKRGAPRRQYGTAILSARPLLSSENILLPRANTQDRLRLTASTEDSDSNVYVSATGYVGRDADSPFPDAADQHIGTVTVMARTEGAPCPKRPPDPHRRGVSWDGIGGEHFSVDLTIVDALTVARQPRVCGYLTAPRRVLGSVRTQTVARASADRRRRNQHGEQWHREHWHERCRGDCGPPRGMDPRRAPGRRRHRMGPESRALDQREVQATPEPR